MLATGASDTTRRFAVVVHDVAPAFLPQLARIVEALAPRVGRALAGGGGRGWRGGPRGGRGGTWRGRWGPAGMGGRSKRREAPSAGSWRGPSERSCSTDTPTGRT